MRLQSHASFSIVDVRRLQQQLYCSLNLKTRSYEQELEKKFLNVPLNWTINGQTQLQMSARIINRYFRLRHPFTVTVTYIQQFFDFSRIGRTTLFSSHSNVAIQIFTTDTTLPESGEDFDTWINLLYLCMRKNQKHQLLWMPPSPFTPYGTSHLQPEPAFWEGSRT